MPMDATRNKLMTPNKFTMDDIIGDNKVVEADAFPVPLPGLPALGNRALLCAITAPRNSTPI